jgi:hypothetical protein
MNGSKRPIVRNLCLLISLSAALPSLICSGVLIVFGKLHIPIDRVEDAEALIYRLISAQVYLENYMTPKDADDFALLYANTFLLNTFSLSIIVFLILANLRKLPSFDANYFAEGRKINSSAKSSFLSFFAILTLLVTTFFIILMPQNPDGMRTVSVSRAIDAQYGIIQGGFAVFNLLIIVMVFILFPFFRNRAHKRSKL